MVKLSLLLLFKFTLQDICLANFTEKPLVSVVKKKKKKDLDQPISAVTNIRTRISCLIREYLSTRILAAAPTNWLV